MPTTELRSRSTTQERLILLVLGDRAVHLDRRRENVLTPTVSTRVAFSGERKTTNISP